MKLLARVLGIDVSACQQCQGALGDNWRCLWPEDRVDRNPRRSALMPQTGFFS